MPDYPPSVVAAAPPPIQRQRRHQFLCKDDASIRTIVARVCGEERAHILNALGSAYTAAFHSVGFSQEGRPLQILSPFDIEPGATRREYLEVFATHEANNTLENMPKLVYWFDASLQKGAPQITLESGSYILSYERGLELNYDQPPKAVIKKLLGTNGLQSLTASEKVLCKALTALEEARESGTVPVPPVQQENELYKIVSASEMLPPTSASPQKTAEKAAIDMETQGGQPQPQSGMPEIGARLKVFWESLDTFFSGYVDNVRGDFYFIVYDDDETQWLPLADHRFEILDDEPAFSSSPPAKSPPRERKKNSNAPVAAGSKNDNDSETEWDGSLVDGGSDLGGSTNTARGSTVAGTDRKRKDRYGDKNPPKHSHADKKRQKKSHDRKESSNENAQKYDAKMPENKDCKLDPDFKMRLEELQEFIAKHGHMNIILRSCHMKEKPIYHFIQRQRGRRKALPHRYGTNRVMSQAEIDALDAIGFDWGSYVNTNENPSNTPQQQSSPKKCSKSSRKKSSPEMGSKKPVSLPAAVNSHLLEPRFKAKLEALWAYLTEHGHMNISFSDTSERTKPLYCWIKTQRLRKKAFPHRYGKNRAMPQAEIDALDAIGFDWGESLS